ncbi:pyruvate dehydrogenase (acetyl-transferring) E1 component subunit alpha [Salipaludibacillus keqinensis]|uniref:Pyruvate dehydrogenase E1 component subunit alpha n=1 Tax=Salipaludibacillus keqinensis TaxID=2045207 RepID=A0A323TJU2_9BACI|nr:pyruvate dehydrogenase (acetyl-transferring) E1 component subunit alpha [Salipaludibacillus keqinensis]PYZ94840.1 pyruvate dehydrogenase (acetyl-transferring) E1 component subunit alpha [Salipaludibacillus keqinensis]
MINSKEIESLHVESDELYQVLSIEGDSLINLPQNMDSHLMLEMYKKMVSCREFDEKAMKLQRQGRLGTYASFKGQEASQVGSSIALEFSDWMFPTYRDHAATHTHGQKWSTIFLYWMGHIDGSICPEGKKILPPSVPIATQLLHAVGTAWADKLKGEENVSIVYFGDGATSEGDFHEALNFSGVFQTPTVFFCQNNQFAISVPFEKQSASKTIKQRAHAYDMKGVRIDGNDIFAVYLTVKEAVDRARNGGGPTLIEAVTTRYGSHTTADDSKKYRNQEKIEKDWPTTQDPIPRLEKYLRKNHLLDKETEDEMKREIKKEIDEALSIAENYPKATTKQMFEHVYAVNTATIKKQEEEFLHLLGEER